MRILFIAMANSVHTTRWIKQLTEKGWDIHLFPVDNWGIHPDMRNLTIHNFLCYKPFGLDQSVKVVGSIPVPYVSRLARRIVKRFAPSLFDRKLARTIRLLKPDIIHTLEMQHAGYLTLAARKRFKGLFPIWIMSIWGSDIYHFGKLPEHVEKIKAVLSACDYFGCECKRDEKLARNFGFKGESLIRVPMWGGLDVQWVQQYRQQGLTSSRRLIVLKGYQGWAGRALVGLRAIELCADVLKEYQVAIYLANEDVKITAELISKSTGIPIKIIPYSSHEEMLKLHGHARLSISLSISDGLPASFIEAMVMGSFPIQSNTACAEEWIEDGKTGSIVPPEDPKIVATAIRDAVINDSLVNYAADINSQTIHDRLDYQFIQSQVIAMYKIVESKSSKYFK